MAQVSSTEYLEKYLSDFAVSNQDEETMISNAIIASQQDYLAQRSQTSSSSSAATINEVVIPTEEEKKLWFSYKRIEQPKDLNIKLFPHQLVTVYDMELLERTQKVKINENLIYQTSFSILGDIPGYGKSISIVALILRDKMSWDISKPHLTTTVQSYGDCLKSVLVNRPKVRISTTLLLVSPNLVEQWKEYFNFVKPGKLTVCEIVKTSDIENFDPEQWDVVIVSSVRYNEFMKAAGNIVWKRFVFDDAPSTPIPNMANIEAGFTWFVSATYNSLLRIRNVGYMRCFFRSFDSNILQHLTIVNNERFIRSSFKMPETIYKQYYCVNPRIMNVISNYIDAETRRMIGANDFRAAVTKLGGSIYDSNNLVEIVLKKHKKKLHDANMSLEMWSERHGSQAEKEKESWTRRVKELEANIKDIETKYKNILSEECSICYSTIENAIMTPCCNNVFCGTCIIRWLEDKKNCPMCRSPILPRELIYIDTKVDDKKEKFDEKEEEEKVEKMEKTDTVLKIVKDCIARNGQILLFSEFEESFNVIRRNFVLNKIPYVELSGQKTLRDQKIKRFHEGEVKVIFVHTRYSSAGLNLQNATDIIFYHKMEDGPKKQCLGRALRVGRSQDLIVHELLYDNE